MTRLSYSKAREKMIYKEKEFLYLFAKANNLMKAKLIATATERQVKTLQEIVTNFKRFASNELKKKHLKLIQKHLLKIKVSRIKNINLLKYRLTQARSVLSPVVLFVVGKIIQGCVSSVLLNCS